MFSPRSLCLAIIIILLAATITFAQSGATSGTIVGTVKDSQDLAIVGATINARELATNLERTAQLREDGLFQFTQLPPGHYRITAQAAGFSSVAQNITLYIGTIPLVKFVLPVGSNDQVIEVTANSLAQLAQTEQSRVIAQETIQSLPINRRNFLDFTLTTANVIPDRAPVQGTEANSMLNFNGQNARQNSISIDGLDNNDLCSGSVRATYSQEAVKEFQVVSNNFSAQFGRASAGIINIVTKSGENHFHGSLFLFNRNDQISAKNAFSLTKPPFSQYQFGATLAGPIKTDRAHFFTAFERLTLSDTTNVGIAENVVASLNRLGFPTRSGDIAFSEASTSFLLRTDLTINQAHQVALKYSFAGIYNGQLEPFGTFRAESIAGIGRIRDDNFSLNENYLNTDLNLVNEFRLLFARRKFRATAIDPIGPKVAITTDEQGSITTGRSFFLPNPRQEEIYQIVNNSALARHRQQLKFGFDYLLINIPEGSSQEPTFAGGAALFQTLDFASLLKIPGLPRFTALEAFDPSLRTTQQQAFLTFLGKAIPQRIAGFPTLDLTRLSIPLQYIQGFGDASISPRDQFFASYLQDDISITSNLILKLGLRYDLERISVAPSNSGNFSPRIALSWRPGGSDRLSLFGAYGIFHGTTPFAPLATANNFQDHRYQLLALPLPFSIIPFSLPGHKFPASINLPTGINIIPQLSVSSQVQPDLRSGYTQQVNLGFNYLLNRHALVNANYQYVRGIRQFLQRDINPVVRPIPGDPIGSRVTGRIDTSRGTVVEFESNGDSYYNALTLQLKYQFESHFMVDLNYTFAKTIDDYIDYRPEYRNQQDPLNLRGERSYSNQDIRNRFVLSGYWFLNFAKNPLLHGYQLSTIITAQSGRPYNLITGLDLDLNADTNPGDRPNRMPRNLGIEPGFFTTDLRLTRQFQFKDKYRLETFFEAFNLFNNVNITTVSVVAQFFPPNPDGSFNLPPLKNGRYTFPNNLRQAAFAPRRLQLGFRFSF